MRILVVRRDNIGDLVCTTPLFAALRRRHPQAWLGALVNSYNAPVLEGNPDLDAVFAYTKLKHREDGQSAFAVLHERLGSLWRLRRMRLDVVALATSSFVPRTLQLARALAPRRIAGFSDGSDAARALDVAIPLEAIQGRHEVERVFALAQALDAGGPIPPLRVVPAADELARASAAFAPDGLRVAVHVSARRPAQRWPAEHYAALIERLGAEHGASVLLLWSPGPGDHPQHPGDDDKAAQIMERLKGRGRVAAYRTDRLQQLIGALAASQAVVCSDGGALHLAAGLGKPIACFFGDSPAERWRPWGVPCRLLQPASRDVRDISVAEAAVAFSELLAAR